MTILYLLLGIGAVLLLYFFQNVEDDLNINKVEENITRENKIRRLIDEKGSVSQNLNRKYNYGTYRDKKGKYRSIKNL